MFRSLFFLAVCFCTATIAAGQAPALQQIEAANKGIAAAMQKSDFKTAAKHAREAITLTESHFGPNSRYTAISYENLGTVLASDNKHKLAVEPFQKALEIFRQDPKNSKDEVKILGKLADAQFRSGKGEEAEATLQAYRANAEQRFGPGSRELIQAKVAMGCYHARAREAAKALDEFVESYAMTLNSFGRESAELDYVATGCQGSLIEGFWGNHGRMEAARKKLSSLLGYEMGAITRMAFVDQSIPFPARPIDITAHTVVVKVWIDEKGKPRDAKLIFGGSRFNDNAIAAAKESEYRPSIKDGKPIEDVVYFAYTFIRR